jgi:cyclopropane-fatty-acyl-phospholipid synthase
MNRVVVEAASRTLDQSGGVDGRRSAANPRLNGQNTTPARPKWCRLERLAIRRLLNQIGNPPLTVVLEGAGELASPTGPSLARVVIRDRLTLWKVFLDPLFAFGEAYAAGTITVEGDLVDVISAAFPALQRAESNPSSAGRLLEFWRRPRGNSLSKSRDNITHHYDIGNPFYELWLDEQLLYTCAYFAQPTLSLEQAQLAKMDHVCRKLQLRPGQTVLEAGCGWGALARHMARYYGVSVKAFNVSHEQIVYARQQARYEQLSDRVEFIEDDWRNMQQPCDVFVSVGMLEHVGLKNYEKLGATIRRCLHPHGYGLIHSIAQNNRRRVNPWIERRIFPGAYPPTLGEMMGIFETNNFSVLDVENLRLHYALTLRHWKERFEQAVEAVRNMFDERFVRMWRLYLSGSIAAFDTGGLQLFQVLFTNATNNQLHWTRDAWYGSPGK